MAHWQKRWDSIIGKLETVADDAATQRLLDRMAAAQAPTVLGFVNAHAMNLVVRDRAYSQALSAADVLLRDGAGMAILYRHLGLEPGRNMNGTDFIPRLMAAYRGRRVAFWGHGNRFWTRPCSAARRCSGWCQCRFTMALPASKPTCNWPGSGNRS